MTAPMRETRAARSVRNKLRCWALRASQDLVRTTTDPQLHDELYAFSERLAAELIARQSTSVAAR
jgi:hypothetical protein